MRHHDEGKGLNKVACPLFLAPPALYRVLAIAWLICVPPLGWAFSPGENLLVAFPKGYKVVFTDAKKGVSQIMELVPEGQTVENWKRMITVQDLYTLSKMDPNQFADLLAARFQKQCPKTEVSKLPQASINNRPAARFYFYNPDCGARPGESIVVQVVQGNGALHSVQYAWRPMPPSEQELQEANAYLDRTGLCDTRLGDCEEKLNRTGKSRPH